MVIINGLIEFLIGVFVGGLFMTIVMCALQISGMSKYDETYRK